MPLLNIHYRTTLDPLTDPDHAEKALNEIKKFWVLNVQSDLDSIETAFKEEFPTYKIFLPDVDHLKLAHPIPEKKTLEYQNSFEYISKNYLETYTDTYDKSEYPDLIPWDEQFAWDGSYNRKTVTHPLHKYPQWDKLALLVDDEEGKANDIFLRGLFEQVLPCLDDEGNPQFKGDDYHILG
ncbi:hypothetical protein [Acaryochloris marina]|uniref:Uncharacterized protein n=1 Tax=Acaryochloris marina (strain MBIC 11017) TaxID=329726 RepID=B0C4V4_ACAM1|nr:hypothetical protein [Acaryochloris marina]ABW31092.1 hypothetical protein AM1_6160 [Acaryochloris marina MBIC11017]BDM79802.1 hypothetical protein AM10699_26700 [Acaryochloris marina MBIC10699]